MIADPCSPVAALPEDWESLARPDLDELLQYWIDERRHFAGSERLRLVDQRHAARWAIENGALDRLFSVDQDTADLLGERGPGAIEQLASDGRLSEGAARQIADQWAALDLVLAHARSGSPLTVSFIHKLHALVAPSETRDGATRTHGNGFEDGAATRRTADAVEEELRRLIDQSERDLALGVRPEIEAALLHHRFSRLQPFDDGNALVARALATLAMAKAGYPPLVVRDDLHREAYREARSEADGGDLEPLVELFANTISDDLNDAITYVRSSRGRDVHAIALAAADAARRHIVHSDAGLRAVTDHYRGVARARLREVAAELGAAFSAALPGLRSNQLAWIVLDEPEGSRFAEARGRFLDQITRAAGGHGYAPDLTHYKRWVAMRLPVATPDVLPWHVVVAFHHKVSRAGVMAAVLFLTTLEESSTGAGTAGGPPVIAGARHEHTYSDSHPHDERFRAWLDPALATALEEWQARL